jgi:hypothetical protein
MFTIKKETTFLSKHTGIALKKIEVSLRVDRKIHEDITKFIETLSKTKINSIGEQEKILKKWKIEKSTYSCIENNYDYYLELEEIEDLHIDSLIVDELTFYPYSYKEEFIHDALIIDAKVKLSKIQFTEVKKLIEKNNYFKVLRHGISDEPREMKIGLPLWSKHKDTIKYYFTLSEKKYFETKEKNISYTFPMILNMNSLLAKQDGILKELLTILSNKKVLTNEEITEIKEKASIQSRIREIDFYQVKDIDELL